MMLTAVIAKYTMEIWYTIVTQVVMPTANLAIRLLQNLHTVLDHKV